MADKTAEWDTGSLLTQQDLSEYQYWQAAEDLGPAEFVELNINGKLVKWKGKGIRLPRAVTTENCPKDFYTWVMISEAKVPAVEKKSSIIAQVEK